MGTLESGLRRTLERVVEAARTAAEDAAWAALQRLAVTRTEPFPHMPTDDLALREWLRMKARELGASALETRNDVRDLVEACAYEQWHRMLFARFLAENDLLIHPDYGVPLTLDQCAELAGAEGEPDGWMLAAKYAAKMLPGIFRATDPLLSVRFAPDDRVRLEELLAALPAAIFRAEDSLGWVYQFWQAKRKREINESGAKIENGLIAPVTQLFSEPYMVEFLLHNTLGAWWAARHPDDPLVATFTYLRRTEDGTPICGDFPHWPPHAAELTIMDPCAGSGHFLQRAFTMLRQMREREESLDAAAAGDAVLRENLFGLELDARCVQITAFALAFEAWKSGGYRKLPVPYIACSGIAAKLQRNWWTRLVEGDEEAEWALRDLHDLFIDAADLGSLIGVRRDMQTQFGGGANVLARVQPKLESLLERTSIAEDPVALVFGESAVGAVRAARLLLRRYHLVASNVPFLARGRQSERLRTLIEARYADAKADLATAMLERCRDFCLPHGAYALVTPQNWLTLGSYKKLREKVLNEQTWHAFARLGPGAFVTITGEVVKVTLAILVNTLPQQAQSMHGLDASAPKDPSAKASLLLTAPVQSMMQAAQLRNPDAVVTMEQHQATGHMEQFAVSLQGVTTGDSPRFVCCFWEFPRIAHGWVGEQSTVEDTTEFGGRQHVLLWESGKGRLRNQAKEIRATFHDADLRGSDAWGRKGVAISQMGDLPVTLYTGEQFDANTAVIVPNDPAHLPAIWAFCSSPEFNKAVRRIDQTMKVTNATLVKVPFDLSRWQAVAETQYPNELPEPHSDDPTQWLFRGDIATGTDPLQVAVARLLGYRWPDQPPNVLDAHTDVDGIACVPAIGQERPAAERLRALLAAAYSEAWTPKQQSALLGGTSLEAWLRDGYWPHHCARFGSRPFIWQIGDGRKDGFSALVNYHLLDRQKLEKLTYTYLGDWLERQRAAAQAGEVGAEARHAAALTLQGKLAKIIAGEPPYDIFVRWKPLHEQPIGWEPDLNDGVRLNIRPFVEAGVLRNGAFAKNFWKKDRGENPPSFQFYADPKTNRKANERHNDFHFTRAEKEAARREHTGASAILAPEKPAALPARTLELVAVEGDGDD